MSSIREQILARMLVVLTGTLPNAIPVYRSRVDAFARSEEPSVVVRPDVEDTKALSELLDASDFDVFVEVIVRGDVWDSLADPIIIAAHGLLLKDAALATLCSKLRRTAAKWEAHEADLTAGILSQTYKMKYDSPTNSL